MFQRRIAARAFAITQHEALVSEAQRAFDTLSGQVSRWWQGDTKRQEQILRIEQCETRLELAKSEKIEAMNAERQHENDRPNWGRWVH